MNEEYEHWQQKFRDVCASLNESVREEHNDHTRETLDILNGGYYEAHMVEYGYDMAQIAKQRHAISIIFAMRYRT